MQFKANIRHRLGRGRDGDGHKGGNRRPGQRLTSAGWLDFSLTHPTPYLVCIHAIGQSDTGHRCPWFAAGFNNGLLELLLVSPPAAARFLDFHSVHYRFWWTLSSLNTAQIYRWVRHPDTLQRLTTLLLPVGGGNDRQPGVNDLGELGLRKYRFGA